MVKPCEKESQPPKKEEFVNRSKMPYLGIWIISNPKDFLDPQNGKYWI